MNVVISVKDGTADVWGNAYVKAQPLARAQVLMPASPTVQQVIDTIRTAATKAGVNGTVIFNVGHGAAGQGSATDGTVDLAPPKTLRLGGLNNTDAFVDVFYDMNVVGPPALSQQDSDQKFYPNSPEAKRRAANWAKYEEIKLIFRVAQPYKGVFLTCNVGNATDFLKKIARDWQVVVEAFTSQIQLTPQTNKNVRIHLKKDPVGTGTNIANSESELPLATEANSVRVGPALPKVTATTP